MALLGGCATYHPAPLDLRSTLAGSVGDLRHPGVTLHEPLPIQSVAYLAVINNPDLRAARARTGVAKAQVLEAGLLPNPQFTGSYLPVVAGPGTISGWNAGLTEDIKALVTLSARRKSAREAALQVDADLLWQEWQVIAKARLLVVDLVEGERLRRLLLDGEHLLAGRYARTRRALAQGNTVLTAVAPDLVALDAVRTQLVDLTRIQQTRWHDLDALLGLEPDVRFALTDRIDLPPIDPAAVRRSLPGLANRRPDLVALQLGYRAQEASVRAAILGQFPTLLIGLTGGRDTTDVRTLGPQVTFDLPIFNYNQGAIALARATRAQLRAEFTARLAAAAGQVSAALGDIALRRRQIVSVRGQLAETGRMADEAANAFRAGNLDERSYVDLVTARINKHQELVSLEQALLETQIATATLIGAGMPPVTFPEETGPEKTGPEKTGPEKTGPEKTGT